MVGGVSLFLALFNNIAIFIALISLYGYLNSYTVHLKKNWKMIITGLLFGLFAAGCMYARIPVYEGVIVDQRNAIIALSAAFGGPLAGFISAALAGMLRFYLGGAGVLGGIIGVNLAAAAGTFLYFWKNSFRNVSTALLRTFITVIIILPGFLFIGDIRAGFKLMLDMSLPYGSAIFIGILFGGLLLRREEHRIDMECSLKISEEKYRVLFESFPLGITVTDREGGILETNDIAEELLEVPKEEHDRRSLSNPAWELLDSNGEPINHDDYPGQQALDSNSKVSNREVGIRLSDNKTRWLNVTASPIPLPDYGVAVVYNDISDRKQFEDNLEKALDEKTVLIQELFHRTKNNMQLIISLLEIQNEYIRDHKTHEILSETQNRIHSMALVHEKLYESEDLININLAGYVRDIIAMLFDRYKIDSHRIGIVYDLDDVDIRIDSAIPCGIILHELISNVFKHAYPEGKKGTLTIGLTKTPDSTVALTVNDDGVGFPGAMDIRKDGNFGLFTVFTLAELQMNGSVDFNIENGVKCTVSFRNKEINDRIKMK